MKKLTLYRMIVWLMIALQGQNPSLFPRQLSPSLQSRRIQNQQRKTVSPTVENVRQDISTTMVQALKSRNAEALEKLVIQSAHSIMDYVLFATSIAYVLSQPQNQHLIDSYQSMLNTLYQRMDQRYGYSLRTLMELSEAITPNYAYFSSDRRFFHYDYYSSLQSGPEGVFVTPNEGDLSPRGSHRVVEELLSQQIPNQNDQLLIGTLREELRRRDFSWKDLEYPVWVIRIQEGQDENIFLIMPKLRKGNKRIGFILAVARNSLKAEQVKEEFMHLSERSGDPRLVRVWKLGETSGDKEKLSAYTSHLMNSSEINYISRGHWATEIRPAGYFITNSMNPYYASRLLSSTQMISAIRQVVSFITYYYDPEKQKGLKGYSVNAGDANLELSAMDPEAPWTEKMHLKQGEELKLTTIAWRGIQEQLSITDFLDYLFSLQWLEADQERIVLDRLYIDPETGGPVILDGATATFGELIRLGVIQGLRDGLSEKWGETGIAYGVNWLTQYINTMEPGAFSIRERSLFSIPFLKKTLRSFDSYLTQERININL